MTVGRPGIQKRIDTLEYKLLMSVRKGRRDTEHPQARFVGEAGEIGSWHERTLS